MSWDFLILLGTAMAIGEAGCASTTSVGLTCGEGTTAQDGICVVASDAADRDGTATDDTAADGSPSADAADARDETRTVADAAADALPLGARTYIDCSDPSPDSRCANMGCGSTTTFDISELPLVIKLPAQPQLTPQCNNSNCCSATHPCDPGTPVGAGMLFGIRNGGAPTALYLSSQAPWTLTDWAQPVPFECLYAGTTHSCLAVPKYTDTAYFELYANASAPADAFAVVRVPGGSDQCL